jgi:hypothetical protein
MVSNDSKNRDRAAQRAQEAFKSAEKRAVSSKQITETEHAAAATKTRKLRVLRLAKEATDGKPAR